MVEFHEVSIEGKQVISESFYFGLWLSTAFIYVCGMLACSCSKFPGKKI